MLYDCWMVNNEHIWGFDLTLRVFIHRLELHYHSILTWRGKRKYVGPQGSRRGGRFSVVETYIEQTYMASMDQPV